MISSTAKTKNHMASTDGLDRLGDCYRAISTYTSRSCLHLQETGDRPHQLRPARSVADAGEDTRPHRSNSASLRAA
jgi:hypothetical protein